MPRARSLPAVFEDVRLRIASRLRNNAQRNVPRVVTVTSRARREGVTTVAVGLARAFASQKNTRVLLVDPSPGTSQLNRRLDSERVEAQGEKNGPPIPDADDNSTLLRAKKYNFDVLQIKNARELDHNNFQEWIFRSHPFYEVIIVDAGPLQGDTPDKVKDISSYTMLVIDASKTTEPMLERLSKVLSASNFTIDGAILNRRKFYIPKLLYGLVR
jgi:Mrp family chromosome partitioning ATPase